MFCLTVDFIFKFQFPKANVDCIVQKIRHIVGTKTDEVRSFFMRNDPNGSGIIQYQQLGALLRQVDPSVSEHEIMSIARMYCQRSAEDTLDSRKLVAIAQEQLRKRNFEGFGKLLEAFSQEDKAKYVNVMFSCLKKLRNILKDSDSLIVTFP